MHRIMHSLTELPSMASIYRRPTSTVWQCAFYIPNADGEATQVRRSTGTKSRRKAEMVAMEMERTAREVAGLADDAQRKIHAILRQAGEDALRERLNSTKARRYLSEILHLSSGDELSTFTVAGWIEEWLRRKEPLVTLATLRRYQGSCRAFIGWLGTRADQSLEAITTTHVRQFRDAMREGRAAKTVNAYVKDVSSIFKAAVNEGLMPSNPASPLQSLPESDSVKRTPFSTEECRALIERAPTPDWRGVVLVGLYTGLRLSDCASLTWGDIDFANGTLTVIPKKTKRKGIEIRVPLAPPLRQFLDEHPIGDDPQTPIFPSVFGRSVSGHQGLSMSFGRLMEQAGVSRGEKRQTGMYARGFHNLRHTFVSMLSNAGVPAELRRAMAGHVDGESHKLYTHHELSSLQGAIARLPGLE